jgi:hypothetical protein
MRRSETRSFQAEQPPEDSTKISYIHPINVEFKCAASGRRRNRQRKPPGTERKPRLADLAPMW